ncbi:hypothetical protein ACLMJK_007521 [Lecanora helva]
MALSSPSSEQPSRSTSISHVADHLIRSATWSDDQEARLQHCEAELAKAQRRWSESQDLWIGEYGRLQDWETQVEELREIKKAYLKTLKKQQAQAKEAVRIWKKRTWGISRTSSRVDATNTASPDDDADDEREQAEEAEEEEDDLAELERLDSTQEAPRRSSLSKAVRRLSLTGIRSRRKNKEGEANSSPSASQSEVATPISARRGSFFPKESEQDRAP